ncbi:MAG: CoA transferase [Dehalococcoidia bacterium]|nr:CoA transferase [Dehalococcoidia bacterium]
MRRTPNGRQATKSANKENSALSPYRALDLSDEKGVLCGKILGDLGVDVIKIEPPGGDPCRKRGPFYKDISDPEKSLFWFAYNTSKRGITLNIENPRGRKIFRKLVATADFVIESYSPGYMDYLGIGYRQLSKINRQIIMVSISPFGQRGPYSQYKASDLVTAAMGGMIYPHGDADRPPVQIAEGQSYLQASAQAAAGALLALYARPRIKQGQWIDVSVQECAAMVPMIDLGWWISEKAIVRRQGPYRLRGSVAQREIWPCKDGHVAFRILGGVYSKGIRPLAEWMAEEGQAGALGDVADWSELDILEITQEQAEAWERAIGDFLRRHTKAEIYQRALEHGIFLLPGYTTAEMMDDRQLQARQYWVHLPHPELGDVIKYPSAPCVLSLTPWTLSRRAPLVGEHNEEIYCREMGLSEKDLHALKGANII